MADAMSSKVCDIRTKHWVRPACRRWGMHSMRINCNLGWQIVRSHYNRYKLFHKQYVFPLGCHWQSLVSSHSPPWLFPWLFPFFVPHMLCRMACCCCCCCLRRPLLLFREHFLTLPAKSIVCPLLQRPIGKAGADERTMILVCFFRRTVCLSFRRV